MSLYINDATGVDELTRTGSKEQTYKTPAYALFAAQQQDATAPEPKLYVFKTEENDYLEISASALKKARKGCDGLKKKAIKQKEQAAKQEEQAAAAAAKQMANLHITIEEDKSLPAALKCKINQAYDHVGERVKVSGWIHRLRSNKKVVFVVLRDGSGYIQCVLTGNLALAQQTLDLTLESTVTLYGSIKKVPEGKSAPGGVELDVDYYEVVGLAPSGDESFSNKITEDADPSILLDQRHLALRGETLSGVMKVRAALLLSLIHI